MLGESPGSKPSPISCGSWDGHQAQDHETWCWHRDRTVRRCVWQSALGLVAVSGTVSREDHCRFEVVDVKLCHGDSRHKSCGLSQCTSSPSQNGSEGPYLPPMPQSQPCHPVSTCAGTPDGHSFPVAPFPRTSVLPSTLPLPLSERPPSSQYPGREPLPS